MLSELEAQLGPAAKVYAKIAPSPTDAIAHSGIRLGLKLTIGSWMLAKRLSKDRSVAHLVGPMIAGKLTAALFKTPAHTLDLAHRSSHMTHSLPKFKGVSSGGGRYGWIIEPGEYRYVLMYHEAYRAGPHLDLHIGSLSLIYKVKPDLYSKLRFSSCGELTQASKQLLIDHVRFELENRSRVAQNADHTIRGGQVSWLIPSESSGYGAGKSRQLVTEGTADVFKTGENSPIELYVPGIIGSAGIYIHRLYDRTDTQPVPILIAGRFARKPPRLEERLHLTKIEPDQVKSRKDIDLDSSTIKYDGSSCYIVMGPKGTVVYSPRISKRSGHQIEYTHKLGAIARIKTPKTNVAMGELMFYKRNAWGKKIYLPQAVGSGILNGHNLVPKGVGFELRLYRVDTFNGKNISNTDFWENRAAQRALSQLDRDHLRPVRLASPEYALKHGFEGVVIAKRDQPIGAGYKIKYWDDLCDWEITKIELTIGPKGNHAGVVWFRSLESGKSFKLGPGQLGDQSLTKDMMDHPDDYIGRVARVHGRKGHEARAAKLVDFHDDKGLVW